MANYKKNVLTEKPSFIEIKGCMVSKDGKHKDKLSVEELAEFCKAHECRWLKNVNFGNGKRIPHCVLRAAEVRPHNRCRYINEFIEFAKISPDEVEIDKTPIDNDDED